MEDKCISYSFGSVGFQKLKYLLTNIEITLGEGALPRLQILSYSASAGRKNNLVPWKNSCPSLDCTNSGRGEVKAAKAVLRKAQRTRPNAWIYLRTCIQKYNRKAAGLIDALGSILHGLDKPDGEDITTDQQELRQMLSASPETLLRDDDKPRVGRYGEQELCGFVTKFKSLLRDDVCTDQEEEPENNDALDSDDGSDTSTDEDSDDDDASDNDDNNEGDEDNTEQEEADNDVATSSWSHEEGAVSLP